MCGSSGGGGGDALRYQKKQERRRQAQISQGEDQLERLFAPLEGDSYEAVTPYAQFGSEDEYLEAVREALAPGLTEYTPSTTRRVGKQFGGLGRKPTSQRPSKGMLSNMKELGFGRDMVGSTNPEDYLSHYRSNQGYERVEGTGTPIWDTHKQAYLDYANPQLDRQYDDATAKLTYALSRAGQTGGSIAGVRRGDMETDRGQRQLEIGQTAQSYGNKARADLSQQKQSLYQMLNNTANPGATVNAARGSLASISSKPAMSPLAPLFQNATAGLAGAVPAYQQGEQVGRVNQIIYGRDPDQGSGRVVR